MKSEQRLLFQPATCVLAPKLD